MLRLGGGAQMRPLETSVTSVWKQVRPIFLPETNSVSFLPMTLNWNYWKRMIPLTLAHRYNHLPSSSHDDTQKGLPASKRTKRTLRGLPWGITLSQRVSPSSLPTITPDSLSGCISSENLLLSEITMLVYLLSAHGKVNSKKGKILSVLVTGISSISEQSLVYSSY